MGNRDSQVSLFSGSRRCLAIICLAISSLLLCACSSAPSTEPTKASKPYYPPYKRSNAKYHRVRKGDTLYAVSWRAGVDYKTLARWNGLRAPYTIYPGQQLRLMPPRARKKTRTAADTRKSRPSTKLASKSRNTESKPKTKPSSSAPARASTASTANTKLKWAWPVKGKLVESYASNDPSRDGIKIAGKKGQKIQAAESGQVVYVGSGLVGYGRLIIVKHNNKFLSAYGHNSKLLVKEGDMVKKGTHIADMGLAHSGRALLHFEIRKYGKPVDPVSYLP